MFPAVLFFNVLIFVYMSNLKFNLLNSQEFILNEQGKRENQVQDSMKLVSTSLLGLFFLVCLILIFEI